MILNRKSSIKKGGINKSAIETMQKDLIAAKEEAAKKEIKKLRTIGLAEKKKAFQELEEIEKKRREIEERKRLEAELERLGVAKQEKKKEYIEIEDADALEKSAQAIVKNAEKEKSEKKWWDQDLIQSAEEKEKQDRNKGAARYQETAATQEETKKEKEIAPQEYDKSKEGEEKGLEKLIITDLKEGKEEDKKQEEVKQLKQGEQEEKEIEEKIESAAKEIEEKESLPEKEKEETPIIDTLNSQRKAEEEKETSEYPKYKEESIEDQETKESIEDLRERIKSQIKKVLSSQNKTATEKPPAPSSAPLKEDAKKIEPEERNIKEVEILMRHVPFKEKEAEIPQKTKDEKEIKEPILSFKKRVKIRPWKSNATINIKNKAKNAIKSIYKGEERIIILPQPPTESSKFAIRFLISIIAATIIFASLSVILWIASGKKITDFINIPAININLDTSYFNQISDKIIDIIKGPKPQPQKPTPPKENTEQETEKTPIITGEPKYEKNILPSEKVKIVYYFEGHAPVKEQIQEIKREIETGNLFRIAVLNQNNEEVRFNEFLESMFLIMPKGIMDVLSDNYQLYMHKGTYPSLNLITELQDGISEESAKNSVILNEHDMPLSLAPMIEAISDNPGTAIGLLFKPAKINDNLEIRYVTFNGSESGIVWTIYKNYFIISTYSEGLIEIVNRINLIKK